MSSNALSVVFAPVLLRSEDGLARDARDIGQQVAVSGPARSVFNSEECLTLCSSLQIVETLLSLQPIDWSLAEAGVGASQSQLTTTA